MKEIIGVVICILLVVPLYGASVVIMIGRPLEAKEFVVALYIIIAITAAIKLGQYLEKQKESNPCDK